MTTWPLKRTPRSMTALAVALVLPALVVLAPPAVWVAVRLPRWVRARAEQVDRADAGWCTR